MISILKSNIILAIFTVFFCVISLTKSINSRPTEIEDVLYYKPPTFDIKNANITLGAVVWVGSLRNDSSINAFSESFAAICQAVIINSKAYPISFDGIINLLIQEFRNVVGSGQSAVLKVLSNNLFYTNNNSKVNTQTSVDLTGLISNANFGTSKINSLATNAFGLPFITAGDLGRGNPDNQFSGSFEAMKTVFGQIQTTFDYNTFDATLQILKFFNWTLVANLYQSNTYGYNRQKSVLDYSSKEYSPKFACNTIFGFSATPDAAVVEMDIKKFCKCVTSKSTINVIVLWMSTTSAYTAIGLLRKFCSAAQKWTFVITDDFQTIANYDTRFDDLVKYSLFIRNNGPWSVKNFVEQCQALAPPDALSTIRQLFSFYYSSTYNCELYPELANETLKECVNSVYQRDKRCLCTFDEAENDPYASKLFFAADTINVYAAAVSLLQNNCTFLQEKYNSVSGAKLANLLSLNTGFCNLTEFTPDILAFAIRYINITGHTGQIWFSEGGLIRAIKTYYLFNPTVDLNTAPMIGILNVSGTYINESAVTFVDGKVPISEIVPQDPNLSYAVVAVFFGLAIIYLLIAAYMLVFFIYYRNHREIRKGAPVITLVMLIGVTGMSIALLILCLGQTDATCPIVLYFYRLSLVLLFVGLLVKNYRLYKIFSNKTANALVITEARLISFIGIVFLVFVVVLTLIVAVLGYKAVVKQSSKDEYYYYVQCAVPNKTWNDIVQISLQVVQAIPLIASLILAWLTRGIKAEYTESRELAAFATTVVAAMIIFLPLDFTLTDESQSEILRYVLYVEFLSITIIAAFSLLFAPKMYAVYKQNKKLKRCNRIERSNIRMSASSEMNNNINTNSIIDNEN